MSGSENNYRLLISKVDEFIRKYYQNQLIRGLLFTAAFVLSGYFLLSLLEYYIYLPVALKTLLFFLFLAGSVACFVRWLAIPLLAYFRLGRVIDHKTAAVIIGTHFSEVKDKLLNTLQLQEMADKEGGGRELILASINQKISELHPIPFTAAVNLRENRKFIKYALLPAAVLVVMLFAAPHILRDGTYRLVHYNRFFEKPAPFNFVVLNSELQAVRNDDFTLRLQVEGEALPAEVFIEDENGFRYRLEKEDNVSFQYAFKNLQENRRFRFYASGFYSRGYELDVLANPTLLSFEVNLTYPSYLGKAPETLKNTGELLVPEGTGIEWDFRSENTDLLLFTLNGKTDTASHEGAGRFRYRLKAMDPLNYTLQAQSSRVRETEPVRFSVKVVPDLYPTITVQQQADSMSNSRFYYTGEVGDDHGLTQLSFNYTRTVNGKEVETAVPIALKRGATSSPFFYYLDVSDLDIKPGETISYYFEVRDNDGVNGPKSARTASGVLNMPSREEQAAAVEQSRSEVKSKLSEAAGAASRIQENAKKLNEQLIQKRSLDYEEKNQVKDLVQQQKQLEDFLQEIRKEKEKADLKRSELAPSENESLREKQEQIQELFDKVLDEETKKIIAELEKLLQQNNKNLTQEQLQNLQKDNESLENELDRLLELYKQLEFDQLLQENIAQLEQLAEKQEQLAKETAEQADQTNEDTTQQLGKEQQAINQHFERSQEQLQKLEEKNAELENGSSFQTPEKEAEEIQQEMNNSLEELEEQRPGKAAEHQKNAAGQLQRLSSKMQQMREQSAGTQQSINLRALRQILDNLLKVSFDQEDLMTNMEAANPNDPLFLELARQQRYLKDDITLVRDSIYALGKRVPQLSTFVNTEGEKIEQHLENALSRLSDRKIPEVLAEQQHIMTSVNNLAVMLSEVFEQLQQQASNARPGAGEPSQGLAQLNKMQEELNRRLQEMNQGLKPGERVPREKSEELARLAREQQRIRNSLQKLNQELNKDGQGKLGNLEEVSEQMENTETELYNRNITEKMVRRQKEIMTRLLEAEKADRQRDTDDKRESKQGKQFTPDFSNVLEQYNKEKEKQLELIQTLPPEVSSFYREKINEYFKRLGGNADIGQQEQQPSDD